MTFRGAGDTRRAGRASRRALVMAAWLGLITSLGACQSTDEPKSGETGGQAPAAASSSDEPEGDGRVLFETDPPGATMTVNGRVVGRTPVRVRMPEAPKARVGFRLEGYRAFAVIIEPDLLGWGTSYFYPMPPKIEMPPEVRAALEGKQARDKKARDEKTKDETEKGAPDKTGSSKDEGAPDPSVAPTPKDEAGTSKGSGG